MRRRTNLLLAAVLMTAATLVACGSDSGPSSSAPDATAPTAAAGAFPVTVPNKFGETVVPEQPARVVSVGSTEQDILLQLGVVPVGVTEWYGEEPDATWPWAHDLLDGAHPEVLSTANGFEYEKIAALRPDLIVATNAGLTQKDYDLLSAIAPTVTSLAGSTRWYSTWQSQVDQIATALGRKSDGQAIVHDVEQRYADAAAAHPDWAHLTATYAQGDTSDGLLYVYPDGLDTEFLTQLGFTMTPGLEGYAPEIGSQAEISAENVDLLEADVVVFVTESPQMFDQLQDFSTIARLPAVRESRAVYTDQVMAGAVYFLTPLSLEYLLDRLTPMLEHAADGTAPQAYPA